MILFFTSFFVNNFDISLIGLDGVVGGVVAGWTGFDVVVDWTGFDDVVEYGDFGIVVAD